MKKQKNGLLDIQKVKSDDGHEIKIGLGDYRVILDKYGRFELGVKMYHTNSSRGVYWYEPICVFDKWDEVNMYMELVREGEYVYSEVKAL